MNETTPEHALAQLFFADLEGEIAATRRLLERVPADRLGWKPHERSMSLGSLALHIANLFNWQTQMLEDEAYDLATAPPPLAQPERADTILRVFDEASARMQAALARLGAAELLASWTLKRGDQVLMRTPRAAVVRHMGLSHMVHHRGQLSVYLRMLDVPLPFIYGPTADEGLPERPEA